MARMSSIAVFCGSSAGRDTACAAAAEAFGRRAAEQGIRIVFGGGAVGLMGILGQAALRAGGNVVGVIPNFLLGKEKARSDLTELVVVDSMHERKARMFDLADGFAVLPGGFGTLDEAIEVLTWRQLGLHDKPMVFVDVAGYWQPWFELAEAMIDRGFAGARALDLMQRADGADEALAALGRAPEPRLRGRPGRL
jgi:uncharacterized protein (TIGR00730 family)